MTLSLDPLEIWRIHFVILYLLVDFDDLKDSLPFSGTVIKVARLLAMGWLGAELVILKLGVWV